MSVQGKKGIFFWDKKGDKGTLERVKLRLKSEELALMEEMLGMGLRDVLSKSGIRTAIVGIYVGRSAAMKAKGIPWTKGIAARHLDEHTDAGGSWTDVQSLVMQGILNQVPELAASVAEGGDSDDDGDFPEEDPEGDPQTESPGAPSSEQTDG